MMRKAIEHFKDIHFYRFGKPVPANNDSSCDMAWRFRPKEGKTAAFYKDYRRFVIGRSENCTLSVVGIGDYHTGVNARKRKKNQKPGFEKAPAGKQKPVLLPVVGETVNDSLPVVESEKSFSRGKYLIYNGGGDRCKSMNHYLWSFLCALGEAQYLNRTLIMDLTICLNSMYSSSNQDEEGRISAKNKELWPNLAADTSPDALLSTLGDKIEDGRNIYIATNEPDTSFFDPLKDKYTTHFLDEYKDLWDENSEWYSETTKLNKGVPVEFDGYMRVSVDTEVFLRGKKQIETFNDLTNDCKDGINTCNTAAS
ncbi:hypothetical protein GH714_029937 [Hevea brasiliensis]|uniref:Uncharacterized protein n=1 Tax=Hevea brasiliensis TaxID=3981 RepID=A0A6A6K7Q1_HEVBR|nr:hypothetical protein GH714_029937 [Hevea brasiliensis]